MGVPDYRSEPLLDWKDPSVRAAMQAAYGQVAGELGRHYPLIIGGRQVDTAARITSVNPSRPDQVVGTTARAGVAEVEQALAAAREAFAVWSRFSPAARATVLFKAAAIMRRRRYELIALHGFEAGHPAPEADAHVAEAIDFCEYYGRQMLSLGGPQPLAPYPGEETALLYIPLGVGVVHSPFNFPFAITTGTTVGPVVAGNTVLVKPSLHTPVLGAKLFEILADAGLPPGVANFIPGDPQEIGELLTIHPEIRFINFTGSQAVGAHLYAQAAAVQPGQRFLRRVVAEMGGKDAIVVDADADLEAAARGIVESAFGFSGQKCSACSRAIIHQDVYDQVLERMVALTATLTVGPPTDLDIFTGPVISAAARDKIRRYIEIGRGEGRLVAGGEPVSGLGDGYFLAPTIFADVDPDARIAQEEIFGPVLAVLRAENFDDALRIANHSVYALTGAVYTRNRAHVEQARREFQAGNLYINRKCTGSVVGVHPFGGWNMSGTDAKAGGPDYLRHFLLAKSVSERL